MSSYRRHLAFVRSTECFVPNGAKLIIPCICMALFHLDGFSLFVIRGFID